MVDPSLPVIASVDAGGVDVPPVLVELVVGTGVPVVNDDD